MPKSKPIHDTVHIGKANLIRLATKVIDAAFELTVFRGRDVNNEDFEEYSEGYSKEVQGGGNRVDLYLSGKMMRSLLVRKGSATEDLIPVGVINPKSKQKLKWNASDRGKNREIMNDKGDFPFAEKIGNAFFRDVDKILGRKVKKTSETIKVKIKM